MTCYCHCITWQDWHANLGWNKLLIHDDIYIYIYGYLFVSIHWYNVFVKVIHQNQIPLSWKFNWMRLKHPAMLVILNRQCWMRFCLWNQDQSQDWMELVMMVDDRRKRYNLQSCQLQQLSHSWMISLSLFYSLALLLLQYSAYG